MQEGQLRGDRLADDDRAAVLRGPHDARIAIGDTAGEEPRSALGRDAPRVVDVLDPDGHAMEQTQWLLAVALVRGAQRPLGVEPGEGLELRFGRAIALDAGGDQLAAGKLPAADRFRRVDEVFEGVHVRAMMRPRRRTRASACARQRGEPSPSSRSSSTMRSARSVWPRTSSALAYGSATLMRSSLSASA